MIYKISQDYLLTNGRPSRGTGELITTALKSPRKHIITTLMIPHDVVTRGWASPGKTIGN